MNVHSRFIRLLPFGLLFFLLTGCQPLILKGRVVNEKMEATALAVITIVRTGDKTMADANGQFELTNLQVGDTLQITAAGYLPSIEIFDVTLVRYQPITIVMHK